MTEVRARNDADEGNDKDGELLKTTITDRAVSLVKSIAGAAPFVGSLLAELVSATIPNQRVDRVAKFVTELDKRVGSIERTSLELQLANEDCSELLEEGIRQAARSLSDERREYIASLIARSLSREDIEYHESRHLLRILDELNDMEVIWLRFYLSPTFNSDQEFRQRHEDVLQPVGASMSSSEREVDKDALQKSYKQHLARLGLLSPIYDRDIRSDAPQYDSSTGAQKIRSYSLSWLGRLLLREIGLAEEQPS